MQRLTDSDETSRRSALGAAVGGARARAGEARRLAESILTAAVRLYGPGQACRGRFWRSAARYE